MTTACWAACRPWARCWNPAIELVADRTTNAPFDPALHVNARIKREAFALGLACYPGGGTLDGVRGDHVLLAPPYIVTESEVDMIVDRLGAAVDAVLNDINGGNI
jgi:adenosylmethionine-8-amino-7-oxononanoate aminotransferase